MSYSAAPRILYVEDNQDISEYVRVLLTAAGFEITVAGSVVEGLRQTKSRRFDLYLLDNFLPDGSGIELCRLIRTFDLITPIVLYSSIADKSTQEAAFTAGAQRYIAKQEALENLEQTVSQLVASRQKLKSTVLATAEKNARELSQHEFDELVQRYNTDFRYFFIQASVGHYDSLLASFLVLKDFYCALIKFQEITKLEFRVTPYPISLRPGDIHASDLEFNQQDLEGINGFLQSIRESQGREFEEMIDEGLPIMSNPRQIPLAY